MINPSYGSDYCAPDSTNEEDAIKGKWVRVPRNLNREGGYISGWLVSIAASEYPVSTLSRLKELYYRRTRRQDIGLITEIHLYPKDKKPEETGDGRWHQVPTSVRSGLIGVPPLFLWYKTGKTGVDMTPEERGNVITELDVLYGADIPWYGFEKLEPPTLPQVPKVEPTWITYRRGVKSVCHFASSYHDVNSDSSSSSCTPTPLFLVREVQDPPGSRLALLSFSRYLHGHGYEALRSLRQSHQHFDFPYY